MTKEDIIMIWLSLQISLLTLGWMRAEKRASYLEGRLSVSEDVQRLVDEVEPPYDNSQPKKPIDKNHKR